MDDTLVDIYDSEMNLLGVASLDQAHHEGLWHKAALCWVVSEDGNVWLQQRSRDKQNYPSLLDISCAGHVHVNEPPKEAALRILQEKFGIKVKVSDLTKLFTHKLVVDEDDFHNREFCPTYLLRTQNKFSDLTLDTTQVDAIFEADTQDLLDLFLGETEIIAVKGIQYDGKKYKKIIRKVSKKDFYPHSDKFYQKLFTTIQRFVDNQ